MSNLNPIPVNNLPNNQHNPLPPPPPQQLMVAVRATVVKAAVAPRCGGLDMISAVDIAWTGVNPCDANDLAPTANGC